MDAKAPVVLVPETAPPSIGRHVGVAWKRSIAADQAVAAAMPILLKAERVSILIAAEDGAGDSLPDALLAALAGQGVAAEIVRFDPGAQTVGGGIAGGGDREGCRPAGHGRLHA